MVLSFDPGCNFLSYAVMDLEDALSLIDSGKTRIGKSTQKTIKFVNNLLDTYKPDYTIYEDNKDLKWRNQIIINCCLEKNIPIVGCKVKNVREFLFNEQVSKSFSNLKIRDSMFFVKKLSKDELDAIALALFVHKIKMENFND